jgi:hypothetical protein
MSETPSAPAVVVTDGEAAVEIAEIEAGRDIAIAETAAAATTAAIEADAAARLTMEQTQWHESISTLESRLDGLAADHQRTEEGLRTLAAQQTELAQSLTLLTASLTPPASPPTEPEPPPPPEPPAAPDGANASASAPAEAASPPPRPRIQRKWL